MLDSRHCGNRSLTGINRLLGTRFALQIPPFVDVTMHHHPAQVKTSILVSVAAFVQRGEGLSVLLSPGTPLRAHSKVQINSSL